MLFPFCTGPAPYFQVDVGTQVVLDTTAPYFRVDVGTQVVIDTRELAVQVDLQKSFESLEEEAVEGDMDEEDGEFKVDDFVAIMKAHDRNNKILHTCTLILTGNLFLQFKLNLV